MAVSHLPHYGTSFVGRTDELHGVLSALGPGRVLTLVGPGGAGKTRLAVKAAAYVSTDWPDGVWWIDLADVFDDAAVAAAVADGVGLAMQPSGGESAVLRGLAGRSLLLVLDNCEQVRTAVARLIDSLLTIAPTSAALVTSRMPIGADAERIRRIGPLSVEDALALFLIRADAAGALVPDRSGARRICDRLDRLPLALELAAGWTNVLSADQIADKLARPLDLLENGHPDAPYRLRTLDGSVRWSHDLLGDQQRAVFRRLGGFRSGFTLEQAQAVCSGDDLDPAHVLQIMRQLVDASLLVADTSGAIARFGMLEVIATFARDRLAESGEEHAIRARHLDTYKLLVENLVPLLEVNKDSWRAAIGMEYGNLVAAIEWGLTRDDTTHARMLTAGLAWLWHLESRRPDGMRLLTAAVEAGAAERSAVQARTEVALALVADAAAPGAEAYRAAVHGLELAIEFGDHATARLARTLLAIGTIADDLGEAKRLAAENRADAIAEGDVFNDAGCAVLLGILHCWYDEYTEALALLQPAAATLHARGDRGVASTALGHIALAQARTGSLAQATRTARQAIECAQPLQDLQRLSLASVVLAELLAMQGRADEVEAVMAPIAQLLELTDGPTPVPRWELTRARVATLQGRPDEAVKWCQRQLRWAGEIVTESPLTIETQLELVASMRLVNDLEGARELLAHATKRVERLGIPRLLAAVAEQVGHLADDPEAAYQAHQAALGIRAEYGLILDCIDSLEALAGQTPGRGAFDLAVALAAAAQGIREACGYIARRAPLDQHLSEMLRNPLYAKAVANGRALGLDAIGLARRMRGRRGRPASGWNSLTPAEWSVVELAAEGLSNPQIAERLFVSRGTVKTHLAHVYAKLGVANRTELAAAYRDQSARPPEDS